jgi:hypothetical protein
VPGYGSVVFPVSPNDTTLIDHSLGITPPAIASGTTVSVLNGSGTYDQAAQVGQALTSLGEDVVNVGDASQISSNPAETIVYYAPGEQAQAEALMPYLNGNVIMGELSLPAGTDLQIVTGTYLTVSPPASSSTSSSSASGSQATSTPSTSSSGSSVQTSSNPVPTQDVTQSLGSLPSFDPRACPAGMPVTPIS